MNLSIHQMNLSIHQMNQSNILFSIKQLCRLGLSQWFGQKLKKYDGMSDRFICAAENVCLLDEYSC